VFATSPAELVIIAAIVVPLVVGVVVGLIWRNRRS